MMSARRRAACHTDAVSGLLQLSQSPCDCNLRVARTWAHVPVLNVTTTVARHATQTQSEVCVRNAGRNIVSERIHTVALRNHRLRFKNIPLHVHRYHKWTWTLQRVHNQCRPPYHIRLKHCRVAEETILAHLCNMIQGISFNSPIV